MQAQTENPRGVTNTEYNKVIRATLPEPKASRIGVSRLMRNPKDIHLVDSLIGVSAAVNEVIDATVPYLLGQQLDAEIRERFRATSGVLLHHLYAAAKCVGLKLPRADKRYRATAGGGEMILRLASQSSIINREYRRPFYGEDINREAIRSAIMEMVRLTNTLTWAIAQQAPAFTLAANVERFQSEPSSFAPVTPAMVTGDEPERV